jgi:hypothetical protein
MAVPAGTFQTHQAVGNREDLSDVIFDISPMDTPFQSNAGRGKADAVLHEWQTDSLDAAVTTNAHIEGDDTVSNTAAPTSRLANRTQIMKKSPRVAGTQQAVNSAGRGNEMSYQIAKRGRELKRDLESTLLGLQAATAGAAASARVMAGFASFCWTNQTKLTASTAATTVTVTAGAPTTAPTAGTAGTFVEQNIKDCIGSCWDNGGDPTLILTGRTDKQLASAFSGIATQYKENNTGPAAIIGAADVYVSDFGTHQIVADRFMPAGNVYCIDLEYVDVAYLRAFEQTELAKTGDSDRRQLLVEATLCVKAPDSHGKIYTTGG